MLLSIFLILAPVAVVAYILADDAPKFLAWCFLFLLATSFVVGVVTLIGHLCK